MTDDTITFYSIIPIFNHGISSEEFTYSGTYRDACFLISFKRIASGNDGFSELVKNADTSIHDRLESIHIPPHFINASATDDFIFIEVTYPYDEKYKVSQNTSDTNIIARSILNALRLHSSKGILFHNSYLFRDPPNPFIGWNVSILSPLMPQYSFRHLMSGISVLKESDYENCKNTFEILLKNHSDNSSVDKIIELALAYHMTTFNLQTIEHSFLILMIIFEALFKKEQYGNAENAADRISKLISSDPDNQSKIKEEFFNDKIDCFCKIRNAIAHGNPSLNTNDVQNKYPILYNYITQAIIKLITISDSKIDKSKDYYNELDNYLNS